MRGALPLFLAKALSLFGCQQYPGYPEQAHFLTQPPLERPDLHSNIAPAVAEEVNRVFGPRFASLPRLGVVLILVTNKNREHPILVFRDSVRLILPDGQALKPLEPSEITAWLRETYGPTDPGFAQLPQEFKTEYEQGITKVFKAEAIAIALVFRFPQGVPSGEFPVEYVLDLGMEEQIPVKQMVPLNLRP